ncbi:MAG: pyrroline-5-carboxylate reductase [Burkholderiales bacterium]|nr:pyrroline-5-carboxylate reductase [Burkholderiales bacterium]
MSKQKIIFIGGGNMAEAIFAGLVSDESIQIYVIQRNLEKLARLKNTYPKIEFSTQLDYLPNNDDIVFLSIKPQNAKETCLNLHGKLQNCTLISVMAGVTIKNISEWANNTKIIRTMPNTPSSIAKGITAIYFTPEISVDVKKLVTSIFANIGLVHLADSEGIIDKIVPVSSSSIAFIYYFMEGMISSAVNSFGFSEKEATDLVKQVVAGSSALLTANLETPISEQRQRVTSKKGATEQGVLTFEKHELHEIINEAMHNCYARTLEMAKEFN